MELKNDYKIILVSLIGEKMHNIDKHCHASIYKRRKLAKLLVTRASFKATDFGI